MPSIAVVDVLDHLLAPFVLEIDVDIGRLGALFGDEPLEQHILVLGVHRGDPQAITNDGIRGRPAALAQDRIGLAARPGHDVVHGEEILRVLHQPDQLKFLADGLHDRGGRAPGPPPARAFDGEIAQMPLGRLARRHRLVGVFVFQIVQREAAGLDHFYGPRQGGLMALEQPGHFVGGLEEALGVGLQPPAGLVDGATLADTGQHVLQPPAFGRVIEHRAGGDHRRSGALSDGGQLIEPGPVVAPAQRRDGQVEPVRPRLGPGGQAGLEGRIGPVRRDGQPDQPFAMIQGLAKGQSAVALGDGLGLGVLVLRRPLEQRVQQAVLAGGDLALADGEQPAEPSIGGPVARIDDQLGAIGEPQPASRQEAEPPPLGLAMRPHHPGQAVAVRRAQGGQP